MRVIFRVRNATYEGGWEFPLTKKWKRSILAGACAGALLAAPNLRAATFTVTNTNDSGPGSLRQAVLEANGAPKNESHLIVFAPGLSTITLSSQLFVYANVEFQGNNNTISGGGADRIFFVAGGTVNFKDLTLRDGYAKGGNGGNGHNDAAVGAGGGGAGLGGAIFVANGLGIPESNIVLPTAVTTQNVSFASNRAVGGKGGGASEGNLFDNSGGGGGMGGNGGNSNFGGDGGGGGFGNRAQGGIWGPLDHSPEYWGDFETVLSNVNIRGGKGGNGGWFNPIEVEQIPGKGGGVGADWVTPVPGVGGNGGWGGGGGGAVAKGGTGGFGGGGGGAASGIVRGPGGTGGFGGGGGSSIYDNEEATGAGIGGFGAGNGFGGGGLGPDPGGGGGGLGAGGAVFVMAGASFTIIDGGFSDNDAIGGLKGGDPVLSRAQNGQGIGKALFLGANTTFSVSEGNVVTISDSIGGGDDPNALGGIIKTGAGGLVLTGSNSYVGGTTIHGGSVTVATSEGLGTGFVTVNTGGSLHSAATLIRDVAVKADGPGAAISTGAYIEIGRGAIGSLEVLNGGAVESGSSTAFGVLAEGNGTGLISGANSRLDVGTTLFLGYFGRASLTVADGGTVSAQKIIFGSQAGGLGDLILNPGGTVEVGGTDGLVTGAGFGRIALSGGTLKVRDSDLTSSMAFSIFATSTIDTNGFNASFSGSFTGTGGGLTKTGAGTLTLSGENTYGGSTVVNAGTLSVTNHANIGGLGNTSSVAVVSGGQLVADNTLSLNRTVSVDGPGSGISVGNYLEIGVNGTGSLAVTNGAQVSTVTSTAFGVVDGSSGSGSVSGNGSRLDVGTVLFIGHSSPGSLSVGGGGTVTAGQVQLGVLSGGLGTLSINSGGTLNIGGADGLASGAGSYAINLAGTIRVTGADLTSSLNMQLTGEAIFDTNGRNATLSGALSGSGDLEKIGAGKLTLTGSNSYYGLTTVNEGELAIQAGGSIRGDLVAVGGDASGALLIGSGGTVSVTKLVLGLGQSGTAVVEAGGLLEVGGLNGIDSGTPDSKVFLAGGTLKVANSRLTTSSDMELTNLSEIDTNAFSAELTGELSGTGALQKTGEGTLSLEGDNSYEGGTIVAAGTLLIGGSYSGTGATHVRSGATLGGGGGLAGSLHFEANANLLFDPEATLTVDGASVSFGGFGISNLTGLDSSVAVGSYTLIDGSATFDFANVSNFGESNAYDLGDGKSAYFESGSFRLIVVPEPSVCALISFSLLAAALGRRRPTDGG
jgi:autotransporter-associated beta strand protein/T5SS/PEP-CTERM-associated repeat protein